MSIRYTGMYAPTAASVTVTFTPADLQITGENFEVGKVTVTFTPADLQITGVSFSVTISAINYDNGFMIL